MDAGVKWPEGKADILSPYTDEVMKALSTIPLHSVVLRQSQKQILFYKYI